MAAKKKIIKKKTALSKVDKAFSKKAANFIIMKANITAANKQLTEMKSEAFALENEIMGELQEKGQTGISISTGSINIKEADVFNPVDWKKIEKYILKTKDFGIVQRRLSSALLKEMYNDTGKTIAGVEHMTKKSLGITKAKK